MSGGTVLIIVGGIMLLIMCAINFYSQNYSLNIKDKTVGNGQHGTARWATGREINKTYKQILFEPNEWRKGKNLPKEQGLIVGCKSKGKMTTALVDMGDVHAVMVGAAGIGKTAYWLYPCIEYVCATGMSFLSTDTKGDVVRNYGTIAEKYYGYNVSVIDLRNPTRSNGNNLLHLVNKYIDLYKENPDKLVYKSKSEKYAKIIAKTIILSGMDAGSFGQNAYFYDAAEGLLTATILLVSEFCKPEERHIVSVFKIIQELLAPSNKKGKNQFQQLMELLPDTHKAKWFAGAALNTAEQSMASVMSTALSRLNSFLDSELEQILCFESEIDAERFCSEKSAIFVVMPEENPSTFFMISLIIQQLYREILSVADENGGKLKNRCVFFCDEFGTLPKIESAEMMFSASRSRRLQIVPIIQSFAQLEKNYGKEGADIIIDNLKSKYITTNYDESVLTSEKDAPFTVKEVDGESVTVGHIMIDNEKPKANYLGKLTDIPWYGGYYDNNNKNPLKIVIANVSDDVDIDNCIFSDNDTPIKYQEYDKKAKTITLELGEGEHDVSVTIKDYAGNEYSMDSIHVYVGSIFGRWWMKVLIALVIVILGVTIYFIVRIIRKRRK